MLQIPTPPANLHDGFFDYLGSAINSVLMAFAEASSEALTDSFIQPTLTAALTLYFVCKGYLIAMGKSDGALSDLMLQMFKMGMILFIGLNSANYLKYVIQGIEIMQQGIVRAFSLVLGEDMDTAIGPWDAIDKIWASFGKVSNQIWEGNKKEGIWGFISNVIESINIADLLFKVISIVVIMATSVVVTSLSVGILAINQFGLTLTLALGPIFFALFLFPATKDFFFSWLKTLLTPVLAMCLIVASLTIFSALLTTILEHIKEQFFVNKSSIFLSLVGAALSGALGICIICVLKNLNSMASSMIGGAHLHGASLGSLMKSTAQGVFAATTGGMTAASLIASGAGNQALGASLKDKASHMSSMARWSSGYEIAGSLVGGIGKGIASSMSHSEKQRFNQTMGAANRDREAHRNDR